MTGNKVVYGQGEDLGRVIIGGLHIDDLPWVLKTYGAFFEVEKWIPDELDGYHYTAYLRAKSMQHYIEYLNSIQGVEPEFVPVTPVDIDVFLKN